MTEQQPKSAVERLQELDNGLAVLNGRLDRASQTFGSMVADIARLQTQMSSLTKMMYSIVGELKDSNLISDDGIMRRVRQLDDENDRGKIQDLVKAGFVEEAAEVGSDTLVVTSQKAVKANGEVKQLTTHLTIEMPNMSPDEKLFLDLLGKKTGEQFKVEERDGAFVLVSIEKIYKLKESGGADLNPSA